MRHDISITINNDCKYFNIIKIINIKHYNYKYDILIY